MIKREELANPQSCMNRATDDEMTFVLLARDPAAPLAIRCWVAERIGLGKNTADDQQIVEAMECARKMEQQRASLRNIRTAPDLGQVASVEEVIADQAEWSNRIFGSERGPLGALRHLQEEVKDWRVDHSQPEQPTFHIRTAPELGAIHANGGHPEHVPALATGRE